MSKVAQALQEYQDAVARYKGAVASQGGNTHEGREKGSSAYQASRAGHSSDYAKVADEWGRFLDAWAEEGTGEWWAPFASDTPTILVCSLCKLAGIERVAGQKEYSDARMLPTITRVDGDTICKECVKAGKSP